MSGTIEHIWRRVSRVEFVPVIVLAIAIHAPDPTRRDSGYAGVLPLPTPPASATVAAAKPDPLLERPREARVSRGRVLYAAGHEPRTSESPRVARKTSTPCAEQRVVQGRSPRTAPNS
jgi:hypothetical protein